MNQSTPLPYTQYPTQALTCDPLFRNVQLEISAKPFFRKDDAYLAAFFRELFLAWRSLLKHSETVSLLWFLSEGTEILEYDREMDRAINWAMWQGFAHTRRSGEGADGAPPPVAYTDHPIEITYGDIRRIVALMKRACLETLGKPLLVGTVFDPGSEFALAPFRYQRHTEIMMKRGVTNQIAHIDVLSRFHADPAKFAAYPGGIPEGTVFGEFLGRQMRAYAEDMGYNFVWFSNGLGFGRSPYASGATGQFFDGREFRPDGNEQVRDEVLQFWRLFRQECPDLPVICRGTDFTAGINIVNHAVPYNAIYHDVPGTLVPPPNTPWPALTNNHGLALAGFLSQNANCPAPTFPLRYYTTDPWFNNNPWFDRWNRSPHDLYLSGALCKLGPDGAVRAADRISFLTVDGAWGDVPEEVPDEVVPHAKRVAAFRPDAVPPVLWVYPSTEYETYAFGPEKRPAETFGADLAVIGALNHALPLTGVVSTDNLATARAAHAESFAATTLVTPAPDPDSAWERALFAHLDAGGSVLCYGTLAHASAAWLARLGLRADAAPVDGELSVRRLPGGEPMPTYHDALLAQGGLVETADPAGGARILAEAEKNGETRVLAAVRGRAAWVRGGTSATREGLVWRRLDTRPESESFATESLFLDALDALGWSVRVAAGNVPAEAKHFLVSRCRNGYVFTGHTGDDGARLRVAAPMGAPVPIARKVRLVDGAAEFEIHTWFHDEVKVFVSGQRSGVVGCMQQPVITKSFRRRLLVSGLDHATLRFYVEAGCERNTKYMRTVSKEFADGRTLETPELRRDATGVWFELHDVTGPVSIGWGLDEYR